MSEEITVHVPPPETDDRYCVACGADEKTGENLVGGFLPFLVVGVTIEGGNPVRWRHLCGGCLVNVLRACRIGWAGQVAELSVRSPYLGEPGPPGS